MSMEFLKNFKLEEWWQGVLVIGILCCSAALLFRVDFLESKHLFGLGFGMILIGVSLWIATRSLSWIKPPNAYTGGAALITQKVVKHNFVTILFLIAGIILVCMFGFFIVRGLI